MNIHAHIRTYIHTYIHADRQTDSQPARQAGRQAGRQTDRERERERARARERERYCRMHARRFFDVSSVRYVGETPLLQESQRLNALVLELASLQEQFSKAGHPSISCGLRIVHGTAVSQQCRSELSSVELALTSAFVTCYRTPLRFSFPGPNMPGARATWSRKGGAC